MIGNVMLVTACPECNTTFRITVGILEKAGGQVRCGRCAMIFDANAKLREIDESQVEFRPASDFKFELQPEADASADTDTHAETDSPGEPVEAASDDAPDLEGDAGETDQAPDEPEVEADDAAGETDDEAPALAEEVSDAADEAPDEPDWLPPIDTPGERRTWPWAAGTAAAALLLVGQFVHHYRSELVTVPAFGPALSLAYAGFGTEILPAVDLDQYDLLDLTAVAEPSGEEQGWLVIETRVRNGGPNVQPYPHILVRLLDRWEDTVAARYFAPEEYAVTSIRDSSRMNIGSTLDAQFIIMDPGPSATGFELELCVKSQRGFECESDNVDE